MESIEGKHGKGSITKANATSRPDIEWISTGHFGIDANTGGGIPRARITEVFADESCGKTTLLTAVTAVAQDMGLTVAYIDVEHAIDFQYTKLMGVNLEELWFSQPDSAEQALDIVMTLVKSNEVGLIVVDSVAALVTKLELEKGPGEHTVGELARLMSAEFKKLVPAIHKSNCAVVFINQKRDKINTFGYGEKSTTSGGRALKFYASLRLELKKINAIYQQIAGDKIQTGVDVTVKTVKNKVGPAMRTVKVQLNFPTEYPDGTIQQPGFDGVTALIEAAVEKNIMEGGGAKSYVFSDGTKIKGIVKARAYLASQPKLQKELMAQVMA